MMQHKTEQTNLTLTSKQLQAYGLSKYQVQTITKSLQPIEKKASSNVYALAEIITVAYQYLERTNIKNTTHEVITKLIHELQARLGNKIEITFGETSDPNIHKLAAKLITAMSETDRTMANLRADAAEIESKYEVKQ